jgi:hypothetical protein
MLFKQWGKFMKRVLQVICFLFLLPMACYMPVYGTVNNASEANEPAETIKAENTDVAGILLAGTNGEEAAALAATGTGIQRTNTAVPFPARTAQPTTTAIPGASFNPICDQAGFVRDITIPEGTVITSATQFVKTWRLINRGTCTWTPDYALVFASGAMMDGPFLQKLGVSVLPGRSVDLSITLRAPGKPGLHTGEWQLRNAAGALFGIGADAHPFPVTIQAITPDSSVGGLDFTANICTAEWTGGDNSLACLGRDGDARGFLLRLTRPILENGSVDDEPALLMHPPRVTDGVIRGKYSPYTVKDGDHFQTIIGCEHNAKNCSIRFQLDYQIDDGPVQTFSSWEEDYDGQYTVVNQDLSSLAGNTVHFILTVIARGEPQAHRGLWLYPRITPR